MQHCHTGIKNNTRIIKWAHFVTSDLLRYSGIKINTHTIGGAHQIEDDIPPPHGY